MNRVVRSFARRVVSVTLRIFSISLGAWLAAVLPVEIWADQRRAANVSAGHMPTVVAIAAVIAVVPLFAVILIETVRCWAMGFEPLTVPACVALGASASWPVGGDFTLAWLRFGNAGLFVESTLCILAFYAIRRARIVSREQRQRVSLTR